MLRFSTGTAFVLLFLMACHRHALPISETVLTPPSAPDSTELLEVPPPSSGVYVVAILKKTPCYGSCPAFEAQVNSDGSVLWNGQRHTLRLGVYRAVASEAWIKELLQSGRSAGFFQMSEHYPKKGVFIADVPEIITFLNDGSSQHRISDNGDAPLELKHFEKLFTEKLETLNWKQ